jgi:hypothetical protein
MDTLQLQPASGAAVPVATISSPLGSRLIRKD